MNNWPTKKLGEVASIVTGKLDANKANDNGIFPFYTCGEEVLRINTPAFDGESILVAGNGDFGVKYHPKGRFNAYQRTYVIKNNSNYVDALYLYYILSTKVNSFRLMSQGGIIKYLRLPQLQNMDIPAPAITAQKKIVERLDEIRRAQEFCDQQVQKTEELFDSLISTELETLEIETQLLGKVCSFQYGYTQSAQDIGKYRFIRITDIDDFGEIRNDAKFISDDIKLLKPYILNKGDLLLARTGATYGKILHFNLDQPAVFASFLIRIIPDKSKILPEFIWLFSRSKNYWDQAKRLAFGTGQPQFNANKLKEIKIKLPDLKSQKIIIKKLKAVQDYKKLLQKQKLLFKELFDSVLDKSMTPRR